MKPKLLILLPYPLGVAPSQRYRIEHFIPHLENSGYDVTCRSFWDLAAWRIIYHPGKFGAKAMGLFRGFLRRWRLLGTLHSYDAVWVHREISPVGKPLLAWYLTEVLKKKMFFEFDDAIWLPNVSPKNKAWRFAKSNSNADYLIKRAFRNIAGNEWLAAHARKLNPSVHVLPTLVNTEAGHHLEQDQSTQTPAIGWTGSHSTLRYLEDRIPLLRKIYVEQPFTLVVISDTPPSFDFPDLRYIPWNAATEAKDLLNMHIGIMPLPDEEWVQGKCGFKLIQYMALGIVPVADKVGVNGQIVQHKENGLLCQNTEDWEKYLLRLLQEPAYRQHLAAGCRASIEQSFSVEAHKRKFLHLLNLTNE